MPTVKLAITTSKRLAPLVSEALFLAGAQGLEEQDGRGVTLVTYGERRASLAALWRKAQSSLSAALAPHQLPHASITQASESWRDTWQEQLRPVRLTPRLWLAPTTAEPPPLRAGQTLLLYQPALAFGDGDHPTTQMAAQAIERHYRKQPGGALLDIGAGTGVLSLVAIKSGARRALGTDTDPVAVEAAGLNASLNGLASSARFRLASARVTGRFDLIVANIELGPLLAVLAALPAAARRAERLLVTGFLRSQRQAVANALKSAGFRAGRAVERKDWVLLDARR